MAAAGGFLRPILALVLAFSLMTPLIAASAPAFADEPASTAASQPADGSDSGTDATTQEELAGIAEGKADGTYYGSGEGYQSTVTVAVTVEGGRITAVKVVSHADDAAYIERAERLIPHIIEQQTADVDTISGVTYSSRGIIAAVKDALTGSGAASLINGMWMSGAMIALAIALFVAAGFFARRWLAARTRPERDKASRAQRWCVQAAFFILAPSSFATAFIGVKTLFMQVNVMNTHRGYDFELMSFTIFVICLLVFTVVFGRFFCGYACSFGLMGDALYAGGDKLLKKLGIRRRRLARPLPRPLAIVLRSLKYLVCIGLCAVVLAGFYTEVNADSPWTSFSALINLSTRRVTIIGGVLLALIAVGMLVKERFFCEYLCPLGAIFSVLPVLATGRMKRKRPMCLKGCAACANACPVNIEPKQKVLAGECIDCGRCADVCPQLNVTAGLESRDSALRRAPAGPGATPGIAVGTGKTPGTDVGAALAAAQSASSEETPRATKGEDAAATVGAALVAARSGEANSQVTDTLQAADAPARPKMSAWEFLTMRPVAVLWKSGLLLALLWILKVTRFLPM